jgi:recombination protein RecT
MTSALAAPAANNTKVAVTPKERIETLLMSRADDIARVLPRIGITPEKMLKVAMIAIGQNPKLLQATQASILASVLKAAELGLELSGALGHAYLVPYEKRAQRNGRWETVAVEAQLIIGYRGMIELARRSGQVAKIEARIVREGDFFDHEYGTDSKLVHKPAFGGERRPILGAYAVATLRDGTTQTEVMSLDEIEAVRARSKTGKSDKTPWATDFSEMARKTVVRRLFKYLPVSVDVRDGDWIDDEVADSQPAARLSARDAINARLLTGRPVSENQTFEPDGDAIDEIDRQDAGPAESSANIDTSTGEVLPVDAQDQSPPDDVPSIDLSNYDTFVEQVNGIAMDANVEPSRAIASLGAEMVRVGKKGKELKTTVEERLAILGRMRASGYAWVK